MLKFVPSRDGNVESQVDQGLYLVVDFGREGWLASFTATGQPEVAVAPATGSRFHATRRHAATACQKHHLALLATVR